MASTTTNWKDDILRKLKHRNKTQAGPYAKLITANSRLLEITSTLKTRSTQLQSDVERLKAENFQLQVRVDTGGGGGGGGERTHALEQKLFRLQEELTELHKKRGENAQQIIDLNNVLQEKERELMSKDSKISDAESNILALRGAQRSLENTILELEATNQMLKDEHQALQLAFAALEEKYQKAQEDNRDLIERWMAQKAKDADIMNEENAIFMKEKPIIFPGLTALCSIATVPSRALCKFDAHDGEVNAVQWGPSGRIFATGGADRKIKLWETISDSLLHQLSEHALTDTSDDLLVHNSVCHDDIGTCNNRGVLTGSNAGIMSVEFDDEENLILGASNDFASRVWSLADQRLRHTLTGHSGKVLAAKFLCDTSKVVTGSHDRTLKVWDLHSRACVKTIFAGSSCNDLVTLHDNNIVSGHFDKRVRFWDIRSDSSTNEIMLQGRLTSLNLAPDRNSLLCCTRDDSIKILDLRMNQVCATLVADGFKVGCDWSRACFSPDGSYAVAGSSDGSLFIWNIAKNKVEKVLKEHSHAVLACSWNPNGSSILSCEKSRKCIYWSDF
ncbi:autophagy-related protein 16-1-like [Pomacea canaliculata]|uniref:autophagy-related protein 16-1-like n=1 Tax=Pomacea canaliculata TaxID=400727 RepID=UPI000D731A80|nr:autophagy-related protein 16-1-like [Pomacea canaliculata]